MLVHIVMMQKDILNQNCFLPMILFSLTSFTLIYVFFFVVGKTTTAHLVCNELGFDFVELNASDARSKQSLDEVVSELLSNKSLAGFASSKWVCWCTSTVFNYYFFLTQPPKDA